MERDGLVLRELHDGRPLRVEYALSPLGRSLLPIVLKLKRWAEESLPVIEAHHRSFDRKLARARDRA